MVLMSPSMKLLIWSRRILLVTQKDQMMNDVYGA
jgi:hypothetical protein